MVLRPKAVTLTLALQIALTATAPACEAQTSGTASSASGRAAPHRSLDVDGPPGIDVLSSDLNDQDLSALNLTPAEAARYQRNNIVGKYLQLSDKLCSAYLQDLTRTQRNYSLIFGSLSTFFGAAGGAFSSASVVRPLSALAGISSGERAEIDADTFVKQTSQVIIAGIKNSRARTYNTIVQVNFLKSVTDWPISVALADVQDYHSRCSLQEGITEAAASITAVAPQSNAQPQSTSAGVAGRSESPPSLASVASSAAAGAAAAVAAGRGSSASSVASAAAGAAAGAATALGGNPSAAAASAAGASVAPVAEPAAQASVTGPAVGTRGAVAPTPAGLSAPADVARIQIALVQKGNASIVVDGIFGPGTVAALKAFQATQTPPLPQTALLDGATKAALGVDIPSPIPSAAITGSAKIKQAQSALLKQVLPLPISAGIKPNGILDARTVAAIVVFQNTKKLPETGVLDSQTVSALGIK